MNMISPPTGVHASPVATPTSAYRPATSLWTLGCPANFSRFFAVILMAAQSPERGGRAGGRGGRGDRARMDARGRRYHVHRGDSDAREGADHPDRAAGRRDEGIRS